MKKIEPYIKAGNKKIHNNCLIFSIPTSACFGCGKQCKSCYAQKAEKFYPNVLPCRTRNLQHSKKSSFVSKINEILNKSSKPFFRIHEAGDFYSQAYVNKWTRIAKDNPSKFFYAYTKKLNKFDFTELDSLPNVNIINSKPQKNLVNYGNLSYITMLKNTFGYDICPCGIEDEDSEKTCMNTCKLCLSSKKVAFLKH